MMHADLRLLSFSYWRILLVETRPSIIGIEMSGCFKRWVLVVVRGRNDRDKEEIVVGVPIRTKSYWRLWDDDLYFSRAMSPFEAVS